MLRRFARRQVTALEARAFALLYYPHILRTRLYTAAALARVEWEEMQVALSSILHDEFGGGDRSRTHPELYRRYLRAIGFGPLDWEYPPVIPELKRYIAHHYRVAQRGPVLEAIAAVGLAGEWPIPFIFRQIAKGLQHALPASDEQMEIWLAHIPLDEEHALLVVEALGPRIKTASDRREIRKGALESMDQRKRLYDGLERAMREGSRRIQFKNRNQGTDTR